MFLMALTCLLVITTFPRRLSCMCAGHCWETRCMSTPRRWCPPFYLSHPGSCGGLDEGNTVAVPLDWGHGDHPGQFRVVVAGGDEDDPLLVMSSYIYLLPVVLWWPRWRQQCRSTSRRRSWRSPWSSPRRCSWWRLGLRPSLASILLRKWA